MGSSSAGRFGFVFQLPSWDTIEGQMGKFGYTIFQLPSWDTHPKVGRTLGAWDRLSTPFLGYLRRIRWRGRGLCAFNSLLGIHHFHHQVAWLDQVAFNSLLGIPKLLATSEGDGPAFNSLLGIPVIPVSPDARSATFNSLLGIPAIDTGRVAAARSFQLPSWDTPGKSAFLKAVFCTFNSLLGIPEKQDRPRRWLRRLSTPFLGYLTESPMQKAVQKLSTPFLGYTSRPRRIPSRSRLSTPFLGYRYKIPRARGRYRHFQLPSWDTC